MRTRPSAIVAVIVWITAVRNMFFRVFNNDHSLEDMPTVFEAVAGHRFEIWDLRRRIRSLSVVLLMLIVFLFGVAVFAWWNLDKLARIFCDVLVRG